MTIPFTTIPDDKKAEVFWRAMVVEAQNINICKCDSCTPTLVYPDLTLDSLFDFAKKERLEISVCLHADRCSASVSSSDSGLAEYSSDPLNALAIAILRFKGHTVT